MEMEKKSDIPKALELDQIPQCLTIKSLHTPY